MHIKSVHLKDFKRYRDCRIEIPDSVKLVIMAGPNGNGKSSLFDFFQKKHEQLAGTGFDFDADYYTPRFSTARDFSSLLSRISVEFYEQVTGPTKKAFYFRSAYRNEPSFTTQSFSRLGSMVDERRFSKLIQNDAAVSSNYQRLVGEGLGDVFERASGTQTINEFRSEFLGPIREALHEVLPGLELDSLGNPMETGTFQFSKGASLNYSYQNLSGGEKAAFDIFLDYIIKSKEFDDTIACIDEPEAHLNSKIHGKVLRHLYALTGKKNQLWIATHSIGMMREARDLHDESPGSVVFLDFDRDFDQPQVLTPTKPNRSFWKRTVEVAAYDIAGLVAPAEFILCESALEKQYDAEIYQLLFEDTHPETTFLSLGAANDVLGRVGTAIEVAFRAVPGAKVIKLIDRDGRSGQELMDLEGSGCRVLRKRHLESYLFADAVLTQLCADKGRPELAREVLAAKQSALANAASRGRSLDDVKAASGELRAAIVRDLGLIAPGSTPFTFMRDTLVPVMLRHRHLLSELESDVFPSTG